MRIAHTMTKHGRTTVNERSRAPERRVRATGRTAAHSDTVAEIFAPKNVNKRTHMQRLTYRDDVTCVCVCVSLLFVVPGAVPAAAVALR